MASCSISDCDGKVLARGWCNRHYTRWRKYGDPAASRAPSPTAIHDDDAGNRCCTSCSAWLPLNSFDVDARGKGGRRGQCKQCRSRRMKDWYAANQERQAQRQRDRFNNNRAAIRKQDMERYERHKDKRIALVTATGHVRRARLLGVECDKGITVRALQKRDGDACCYCSAVMCFTPDRMGGKRNPLRATVEHRVAVSKGGSHTWDNVALACWQCNCTKNASDLDVWLAQGGADAGTESVQPA